MNKNGTTPTSKKQDKAAAELLKIGIDVHGESIESCSCFYDPLSTLDPPNFRLAIDRRLCLIQSHGEQERDQTSL